MNRLATLTTTPIRLSARLALTLPIAAILTVTAFHPVFAQTAPSLGTAASFSVLGGPAVTLTGAVISGDVGVALSAAYTNTGSTVAGSIHAGDAVAVQAYADFGRAFDELAATSCDVILTGDLTGKTLNPGVYCFDAAATVSGQLTLDGPSDGIWIFKVGTSGVGALTGTGFSVVMANGGQACNVYFQVAGAATLTDSMFQGNILAGVAITTTRGSLVGQALAKSAVTMTGTDVHSSCGSQIAPAITRKPSTFISRSSAFRE